MTFQPIDDLDHVFEHRKDNDFLNLDVLFVADQPERQAFLDRTKDAGIYWHTFKQIVNQTLLAFRHKWMMNYGKEPKQIKIGMAYCSNRWLGNHPPYELLENEQLPYTR